jgi:hypothetical protein
MAGAYFKGGKLIGAGADGDTDTFLIQNFDNATLTDFNQNGLILEAATPISGTTSAKLVHQAAGTQYFGQTKAVPEKYRGAAMTIAITAKSGASLGNVTILFRDETNSVDIQATQQIQAISTVGIYQLGFTIPSNCQSYSYTITALPEAGSPVTYIDDISIRSYWVGSSLQGQTQFQMNIPAVTDWVSYSPAFTNLGSVANNNFKWRRVGNVIEVKGTVDPGTTLAAIATMPLPNGYTVQDSATAGYYYNIGTWGRSASSTSHGGLMIAAAGNNYVYFAAASTFGSTASVAMTPANGTSIALAGEYISIEFAVAVNELSLTSTKTLYSTDIVPAKAMAGNASIAIPKQTDWTAYSPSMSGMTVSSQSFWWRQVGSNIEIRGRFTIATASASEGRITLPNSYVTSSILNVFETVGYGTIGNIGAYSYYVNTLPGVNYILIARSDASQAGLSAPSANGVTGAGVIHSISASIPIQGLTYTETKTWSATQSVVASNPDSMLRLNGANGYGSTANKIRRFSSVVESVGTDVSYVDSAISGGSFTILNSGTYYISYFDITTTAGAYIGISKNASSLTTDISSLPVTERLSLNRQAATNDYEYVGWSGYLPAGTIIRAHLDGTASPNNDAGFTISRAGSLQQIQSVSDQKIKVPTSELRYEGASARGSIATQIVRFDSLTKLRGDAFSIVSDASNGTVITILKSGLLNVNASFAHSAINSLMAITKNQSNLIGSPLQSEIMGISQAYTNTATPNVAASFFVNAGDVIRIYCASTPTAATNNNMNMTFQEQSVSVSVSNVLPQFSDSDSLVKVTEGNTYGSIATKIPRFAVVRNSVGSSVDYVDSTTNGASFTIQEEGIYSITYVDSFTVPDNFGISKNASSLTLPITSLSADQVLVSGTNTTNGYIFPLTVQAYLLPGDVVRPHTSGSTSNGGTNRQFSISKVGKPNVTGVNVTPFISSQQQDNQEIRFGNGTGFASSWTFNRIFGNPTATKGSGLISYATDPTTGTYITALKTCKVWTTYSGSYNSVSGPYSAITLNQANASYATNGFQIAQAQFPINSNVGMTGTAILQPGDVLRVATTASGFNLSNEMWWITAEAASDSILTPPETFSSDTAGFAFSTVYNSSTLANAPVGTFITFQYNTPSNSTKTQSSTAPTQTVADMNANGIQLFTRAWNATSSAAQPACIAIQIGKGMKGLNLNLFKSIGKSITGMLDSVSVSGGAVEYGAMVKEYNEITGVLTIDLGLVWLTTNTTHLLFFQDNNNQTNGYFVINASKNPALTGLNNSKTMSKGVNTSGQIISASGTIITYDAIKTYDTTGSLNAATGLYTAPENGYYLVAADVFFAARAYAAGQGIYFYYSKNGVSQPNIVLNRLPAFTNNAGVNGSDIIYLSKGDTLGINCFNEAGNTALTNATLAIAKL